MNLTTFQFFKLLLAAIAFLILFVPYSKGQDKIITREGDTLNVSITKSTPESVEFTYPSETIINTLYKNSISRIVYSSGRAEEVAEKLNLHEINSADDWEKVAVTYSESDIKGMTKVKEITKSSLWGGSLGSGIGFDEALKKIKKEAAKNKCPIIWLVDYPTRHTAPRGGSVKLVAVAYR